MGIDTVALATGAVPENALESAIRAEQRFTIFSVGDCVKTRDASDAIYEGSKIGREI